MISRLTRVSRLAQQRGVRLPPVEHQLTQLNYQLSSSGGHAGGFGADVDAELDMPSLKRAVSAQPHCDPVSPCLQSIAGSQRPANLLHFLSAPSLCV